MNFFNKKLLRHVVVGLGTALSLFLFYMSRPELADVHRFWRATGDVGFILLFLALSIGPLMRLWPLASKAMPWRRPLGIWFAVTALVHGVSVLDGWIKWDLLKFFGYEFVPQVGMYVRLEPGFGLANLIGLIALVLAILIAAVSSDKALNYLGSATWKWIQNLSSVVFYLSGSHAVYFLFIHFTQSLHSGGIPPNWFRHYVVVMIFIVLALQLLAAIKTVLEHRGRVKDVK